jgi:DNA-binding transcriptional MocR family regulator
MPIATPTWINRIWLEYRAGNLTRAARDVLLTLHSFRGHGGAAWPSHATLADRARCCTRTVQRALAQAQGLGLVSWAERHVRAGWRWLRTSNLYRFVVPEGVPISRSRLPTLISRSAGLPVPTTGLNAAGGESQNKKEALEELLRAAAAAPDLLLRRRLVIEGRRNGL